MARSSKEVERYLQFVAAVRIGYGIGALSTPKLIARVLGVEYSSDIRAVNAFLGSRDIAIGLHSLLATKYDRQLDAVLVNHACEAADSILIAAELRNGRRGIFPFITVPFNISQHVTWIRAQLLLRQ